MNLIINDVHIGFDRKGGTTPKSREDLRDYLFSGLRRLLADTEDGTVMVLGDLFDQFEVTNRDLMDTIRVLVDEVLVRDRALILVAGNHDVSMRAMKVSSFALLCDILTTMYPSLVQVVPIDASARVPGGIAVAHCANQDTFDLRLSQVLDEVGDGDLVYVHANLDNKFAVESDHSLNVSEDVAKSFISRGATLVFAHEHQARSLYGGRAVVLGNQWPTSIADCLSNDQKFAHRLHDDGTLEEILTWSRDDDTASYAEVDWRELTGCTAAFIRVTGEATSNEASEVINAIAKFRQSSSAFIVTNAVKVEGMVAVEALPETFEAAKAFDVMEFIAKHLDEAEMEVVKGLIGSN